MKKMLLVFAHPDDESFTASITVAKYVKSGWQVDLICATQGEAGGAGSYGSISKERLGEIRRKELEKAAAILGISTVTFLGYADGVLSDELPGELEDVIYKKMEELVPDVVITFDTTGVSNHPDHIKICYTTTYAFQKYAFWIEEHLKGMKEYKDENAPKLYYACTPKSVVSFLKKKYVIPDESFERPWVGAEDKQITTVISGTKFQTIKKKALLCHKTQEVDVSRFLSFTKNPLISTEYYILRLHGTREVYMGKYDRVASKL